MRMLVAFPNPMSTPSPTPNQKIAAPGARDRNLNTGQFSFSGLMPQEFQTDSDSNGAACVARAAIQGLNEKVEMRSERAEGRMQKAETRIQNLTEELKRRDAENAELKQRLDALEKIISNRK